MADPCGNVSLAKNKAKEVGCGERQSAVGPERLASFCWVCQECKALLFLGGISGLCLQRSALRDEVLYPLWPEGRFPQAQCFLAVTRNTVGAPLFPVGCGEQEALM